MIFKNYFLATKDFKNQIENLFMKDLASHRNSLGLSQRQYATQLGISQSLLALIENGRRSLPNEALLKMSLLLQNNKKKPKNNESKIQNIAKNEEFNTFKAKQLNKIKNRLRLAEIKLETEQVKLDKIRTALLSMEDSQASGMYEPDSIAYLEGAIALRKLHVSYMRLRKGILLIELNLEGLKAKKVHVSK